MSIPSIKNLRFGDNKNYDRNCIHIFNYDNNPIKTTKRIRGSINNYNLMLNENEGKYDAECIDGQPKWSDTIKNIIEYYTAMLHYFNKSI